MASTLQMIGNYSTKRDAVGVVPYDAAGTFPYGTGQVENRCKYPAVVV